jgi:hypothetical protein
LVGGGLGRLVELCWCVTVVVWMAAVVVVVVVVVVVGVGVGVVVVKKIPPVNVCVLSRRAEKQYAQCRPRPGGDQRHPSMG